MTKEALVLVLLVGGVVAGILYAVRQATSNEAEWEEYRKIKLDDSYDSVRSRFSTCSGDMVTLSDARATGYSEPFKETIEAGGTKFFVAPAGEDVFLFGFDKDDKLVYKNFRRP